MAGNIVYILGAGASIGALPVVTEMVDRMAAWLVHRFLDLIEQLIQYSITDLTKKNSVPAHSEIFAEIKTIEEYIELVSHIQSRRTFDTYAKELYLQGKIDEYNTLKKLLKEYLDFEQTKDSINYKDIHTFFMQENNDYILSNDFYSDYYFKQYKQRIKNNPTAYSGEISNEPDVMVERFSSRFELVKNHITNIINNIKPINNSQNLMYFLMQQLKNQKSTLDQRYINFLVDILDSDVNKIKIFSWNYDTQFQKAVEELKLTENTNAKTLLKNEIKLNGSIDEEEIKFAWDEIEHVINIPSSILIDIITDIVIIGYSFPFSNRKIDKIVLEKIFRRLTLTTNAWSDADYTPINIAIQVPDKTSYNNIKEAVESILLGIKPHEKEIKEYYTITHKQDTESFFIPAHY